MLLKQDKENVMLIGVLSDMHIPRKGRAIPEKIFELFKDVEIILLITFIASYLGIAIHRTTE